jgi:hypothetical protein
MVNDGYTEAQVSRCISMLRVPPWFKKFSMFNVQ